VATRRRHDIEEGEEMSKPNLDVLYTPATIGRLTLKNRFVQSPMHTRFATENGEASDKFIKYHQERARGGVSMIIIENTAVDWKVGRAAGNPIRIDDDVYISGLSDLTEAVHSEGCLIAAQLHHAGRQNSISNTEGGVGPVGPSAIASAAIGDVPRELTIPEIKDIVQQFADGARRAAVAGFDMVEIHGSHGYILTQFLSPQSNVRTDEYGGSFDNRARFPLEVVKAVREAVGPDFPVSFRISVEERTPGGMEAEEGIKFCQMIEEYVDVLNVTVATYESMDSIFMMQGVHPGQLLPLIKRVKQAVKKPVIGISRLGWALEDSARAVEDEAMDFVALARTQLTDPNLVNKTAAGDHERVRRCIACNECVGGFLFKGWRVHCVINPELGMESQLPNLYQIQRRSKKVSVVGGGPAGFEVARAAALRGHEVHLYESVDSMGGQVLLAGKVNFKAREMNAYANFFRAELVHLGVNLHFGETVGDKHPALDADDVVFATGARRSDTADDGILDALAMIEAGTLPEGPLVVRGANAIGLHAAALAAEHGSTVTVVADSGAPGYDVNPILAGHYQSLLTQLGVHFVDDPSEAEGTVVYSPDWEKDDKIPDVKTDASLHMAGSKALGPGLFNATKGGFWVGTKI
jgi:2,4-dienoyl-CoA reductase-like NADH-dependent reductase (Old Yellow Enzyme family)